MLNNPCCTVCIPELTMQEDGTLKQVNKMGNKAITIVISHRQQWDRNTSLRGSSRKKFSKLSLNHLGSISEGKIYAHSPRLLVTSCYLLHSQIRRKFYRFIFVCWDVIQSLVNWYLIQEYCAIMNSLSMELSSPLENFYYYLQLSEL